MEKTTKDFQCDNCEGFGKIQDDDSTLMPCPDCNGSGKSDSKIAAYFRDRLEDALAGVRIVEAIKTDATKFIYLDKNLSERMLIYSNMRSGYLIRTSTKKGVFMSDSLHSSPLEAVDKLLS